MTIHSILGHLHTINLHKWRVMKLCFRCGLIKQGLTHDLSKYSWTELKTGFRYYQGHRSPIDAQKEKEGYSYSWLHHQGRNPHHWEFWLDGVKPVPMPYRYIVEMFCDRVAASQTYQKEKYTDASAYDYYCLGKHRMTMDPKSQQELEVLLVHLKEHGLEATIQLIKRKLKKSKSYQR